MAVRSPSSYASIDLRAIEVGLPIYSALMDDVLDAAEFYLGTQVLSFNECFGALSTTNTSYEYVRRWWMVHRDECGTFDDGSTITGKVSVRCWGDATAAPEFLITSRDAAGVTIDTATPTGATSTTPAWLAVVDLDIETNGDGGSIEVDMRASVAGTVYIGGFAYYA